jgi:hypothetical protein
MATLRAMAVQGLPEHGSLRCTVWKLLLRYLPPNHREWDEYSKKRRLLYKQLRTEFALVPIARESGSTNHRDCVEVSPSPGSSGDGAVSPVASGENEEKAVEDLLPSSGPQSTVLEQHEGTSNDPFIVPAQDDINDFYLHDEAYTAL